MCGVLDFCRHLRYIRMDVYDLVSLVSFVRFLEIWVLFAVQPMQSVLGSSYRPFLWSFCLLVICDQTKIFHPIDAMNFHCIRDFVARGWWSGWYSLANHVFMYVDCTILCNIDEYNRIVYWIPNKSHAYTMSIKRKKSKKGKKEEQKSKW